MSDEVGWWRCSVCGEDWPAEAFRASGSAYIHRKRVCGACYEDLYPRHVTACTGCGGRMDTRGKFSAPTCRACRSAAKPATRKRAA